MTILWWHWLALGLILVALEMATAGGFYMVFFGIAAIVPLGAAARRTLEGRSGSQLILFSVLALGGCSSCAIAGPALAEARSAALRMSTRWSATSPGRSRTIAPGAVGRAELRGTVWSARNGAARALVAGERCRVVTVDQLLILIEPEGAR